MEINVYKDIVPWRDFIRIENIHLDNRDDLINEVIVSVEDIDRRSCINDAEVKIKYDFEIPVIDVRYDVNLPQYSKLKATVESVMLPRLKQYARDLYKTDIEFDGWEAWTRTTFDGRRENPHFHRGFQVVGVYYLECRHGDISLMPPFLNYGFETIEEAVGVSSNYTHSPKSGDLLLFPGHVRHYVEWHEHNLRIALVINLKVKQVKRS